MELMADVSFSLILEIFVASLLVVMVGYAFVLGPVEIHCELMRAAAA